MIPMQVEYAPYQQLPRSGKPDTLAGTIQQDPDYMKFIEELESPEKVEALEAITLRTT